MPLALRDLDIPGLLRLTAPRASAIPLSLDSPHSGTVWPADFAPAAPEGVLRATQDSFVDELLAAAPSLGAPLLAGLFPRVYIDPNRSLDDLDPELLDAPWPEPLAPGEKTDLGKGLIWRKAGAGQPIYRQPLSVAAVQARIARFWQPYHVVLDHMVDSLHARFGQVWHVDGHSMKSTSTVMDKEGAGLARVDIVVSDRDGTACDPAFTSLAVEYFRGCGRSVAVNEPFKGAEIVRRIGHPEQGRHALQIEFNRRLYMDEIGIAKAPGFAGLHAEVDGFIASAAAFVRARAGLGRA